MKARELCVELGYSEFRHFENLILSCAHLIKNGFEKGRITECTREVKIGSGAVRVVKDYDFDDDATKLINHMASRFKISRPYPMRNETAMFSLLSKFCVLNNIDHEFQYKLYDFVYDFRYENTLIEFDESHHSNKRNKKNDELKNLVALKCGFTILRYSFEHDIIDILQDLYFKKL